MKHFSILAVLLCLVATPCWAGFDEGKAAYKRGDYATALREWLPLEQQGDARAQAKLGGMYNAGQGVPQDNTEAVKWYRRAAEQGDVDTQFFLGFMYELGLGIFPQDYTEAAKWYRRAAGQGNAHAQYFLGNMYKGGEGVPQNDAEAAKWYQRAAKGYQQTAEQGDVSTQYFLGNMYEEGKGVPQDYVQAHLWFNLAASSASEKPRRKFVVEARDRVAQKMAPAQLARAQEIARTWQPHPESLKASVEPVLRTATPPQLAQPPPATAREEIPLESKGGVYTVPVQMNGVLITFANLGFWPFLPKMRF